GDEGGRRQPLASPRRFEGCQVYEGLEDRAGLPRGTGRSIERALGIVPPAHEGADLAGGGVDGERCRLHLSGQLGMRLLDAGDALAHRRFRRSLERYVERGLQPEISRDGAGAPPGELRGDQIDEIRRRTYSLGKLARERTSQGLPLRGGVDQSLLLHGDEDLVPPALPLGTRADEERVRRADRAGQPGRLVEAQRGHVLVEEIARGCRQPVDGNLPRLA